MRIAVPTNDEKTISRHFGRSAAFLVFDIESGRIVARTLRPNERCNEHGHHHGDDNGAHGAQAGGHSAVVAKIADCEMVLCAGMGQHAADALAAKGVKRVFVEATGPAEAIVEAYLAGTLIPAGSAVCRCGH
jgi:predicted Fe-Mo cluster-binding NifX family protein